MDAQFRFPGGKRIRLEVPDTTSDLASAYLFGIKKGGSTMLAGMMRDLAPYTELSVFEYPKLAFDKGMPESSATEDLNGVLSRPGHVFGVFRWLPESDILKLHEMIRRNDRREAHCLLLVRDPRDALVSLYYSDARSHPIPKAGPLKQVYSDNRERLAHVGIDDYVLEQAPVFLRHFCRTMQLFALPDLRVLRYEDIVYDKPRLVRALAETMQASPDARTISRIATHHDRIPTLEHENHHIRQVHPGNHAMKLRPETVAALDVLFAPVLATFGYGTWQEAGPILAQIQKDHIVQADPRKRGDNDPDPVKEGTSPMDHPATETPVGIEGLKADATILGTSNSILRGGWVDGLREGLQGEVHNLSAGASASAFVIWQLLDADMPDPEASGIFLLDTMVNDESFIGAGRYDAGWWHYYVSHVLDALPFDRTSVVAFSTQKHFSKWSDQALILEQMCRERGVNFLSLRRVLLAGLRIAREKNSDRNGDDIFEDPGHFHRHLARLFGVWLSRNLDQNPTPVARPRLVLSEAGFRLAVPTGHEGVEEVRSTSLRSQDTIFFSTGQSFRLEGPCLLHGVCVDASNTRAILAFDVPGSETRSIELGYNTNSSRMQVKYVHFQTPIEIGPEGCTVTLVPERAGAFSRGIHSRPEDGPMHGMRLLSFLAGPVMDRPDPPAVPVVPRPNALKEIEKNAVRESGIIDALLDPPDLPKYPRSFIEL